MNTTSTPRTTRAATSSTSDSRRLRGRVGVAVLSVALLSSTACGSVPSTDAAGMAPASTVSTPTSSTTTVPPDSTVPPASTTTPTTITTATITTATTEPRPTVTFDKMVGGEGERIHVRCAGSGPSTVLLIAGFEASTEGWGAIEPSLAARTRVCSYDRPGTGSSDPATDTKTFATQATELHDLLATIGEPGPYIVVGHSFGGAEAVTFASEFTDEVNGLVLIDASPVTWPEAICAVADDGSGATNMLRGLCAGWSDPNGNAEQLDVFAAFAGASTITSVGSLPMAVITAVHRQVPDGLAAEELARLTEVWDRGQQHWSQLSTASRVVFVDDTSHYIQLDHPEVIIDEIAHLLP